MKHAVAQLRILLLMLSLPLAATELRGQGKSAELETIESTLTESFKAKLPDWTYKKSEAGKGSYDVSSDFWISGDESIWIRIVRYPSSERAATAVRDYANFIKTPKVDVEGADEAYLNRAPTSLISEFFRKGEFIIYLDVKARDSVEQKHLAQQSEQMVLDAVER